MNENTAAIFLDAAIKANSEKEIKDFLKWTRRYFSDNKIKVNPSMRYPSESANTLPAGTVREGQDGEEYIVTSSVNSINGEQKTIFRWKKHGFKKSRRVPSTPATNHKVGDIAIGVNGRQWKVTNDSSGRPRWTALDSTVPSNRKAPVSAAKDHDDGHTEVGVDGKMYKSMTDSRGTKRWVLADTEHAAKKPKKSSEPEVDAEDPPKVTDTSSEDASVKTPKKSTKKEADVDVTPKKSPKKSVVKPDDAPVEPSKKSKVSSKKN